MSAILGHWRRADHGECGLVCECRGGLMNAAAGTVNQLHPSQQNCWQETVMSATVFFLSERMQRTERSSKGISSDFTFGVELARTSMLRGLYWYHAVSQIIPGGSQVPTISISLVLPYFATSILRSAQVNRVESNVVCCIIGKPSLG